MIVALTVALGALAQSVSGIGFGLVCGPALVAALGPAEGVRLVVLLSLVVNVVVLVRHHRDVDLPGALGLLVPAVLATPLLALLLTDLPDRPGRVLAGTAAVLGAGALLLGARARRARGRVGMVAAGVVSAAMNAVAGIGGPAVALWADNAGWSVARSRSTLQVYFLGLNLVTLLSLGTPALPLGRVAAVTAALVGGLALGSLVAGRVGSAAARRTTLVLAGAGGLVVLLSAVSG